MSVIVLEQSSKVLILGPKWAIYPHFRHTKVFSQKKSSVIFSCLWNPNFLQKIRKKVMDHFLAKGATQHRTLWQSRGSKESPTPQR